LNYHQKTTRYCLKIQKEQGVENKEAEEYHYECQICLKKFSKKYFETHFKSSCGVDVFKVNTLLKELNTTIKDLKDNRREYLFNFKGGGWNSEWAFYEEEAIKQAEKKYGAPTKSGTICNVDTTTFRVSTPADYRNLMSNFY
jgi:hypothetical protein